MAKYFRHAATTCGCNPASARAAPGSSLAASRLSTPASRCVAPRPMRNPASRSSFTRATASARGSRRPARAGSRRYFRPTATSAAAALVFGYETDEVIGRNVAMLMPPANAAAHDAHLHTYRRTGVRHVIGNVRLEHALRKNGEVFPIELAVGEASIAGERIFTGFIRDISQRQATERRLKELQAELVHVSRVSAMGTMASTLAHEINQPLTAIANYLEATRDMIGDAPSPLLAEIAEALERVLVALTSERVPQAV